MKSKQRRWIVAGGMAALAALPTRGYAVEIVFDPANYAKIIEQVQQDIQMVRQLEAQVQNQLKMLQRWDYSQLRDILRSMGQWEQVFGSAGDTYAGDDPGAGLDEQFPPEPQAYEDKTDADMQELRDGWERQQRDVLVENRTVQNRVAQDLAPTADRIQRYVEKSNAAPGVTAAVQAGNEELATVVAQVQAMQALEITDARGEVERAAQEQAEDAYAADQRAKVRRGWDSPPSPTTGLVNPFPLAAQ